MVGMGILPFSAALRGWMPMEAGPIGFCRSILIYLSPLSLCRKKVMVPVSVLPFCTMFDHGVPEKKTEKKCISSILA